MSDPTPPPSLEEVRDELAMKHYRENEAADRDDHFNRIAPRFSGFCVGWDSALRHLAEAAGGEFDATEAQTAGIQLHGYGTLSPEAFAFKEGARWHHARSWARIQELEAEAERLREALSGFVRYLSTGRFRSATFDRLLKEAREALRGDGEGG